MAGWHSLSGYLYFKEGGGISLLRSKKKLWCVLEESECKLLYFKSEDDVHHNKSPLGSLDLRGSAISLDLDNHNQFVILCGSKEYQFTAENHESMMIWLLGLQSKRDKGRGGNSVGQTAVEDSNQTYSRRTSDITRPGGYDGVCEGAMATDPGDHRKLQWHRGRNGKMWESLDTCVGVNKSKPAEIPRKPPGHRQVTVSHSLDTQGRELQKSFDNLMRLSYNPDNYRAFTEDQRRHFPGQGHHDSSSGGDSDDVFGEFCGSRKSSEDHHGQTVRSEGPDSAICMEMSTSDPTDSKEPGSCSSLSVSSDSAIDKGETTSSELANRLMDLETELISTKCELAKVINQQSGYQELLAQRDDAIRFLEGRLDTSGVDSKALSLKNSKSAASPSTMKSEKEMEERLRILQHQNRFLNLEVKKLAKLQQTERESFFQQEERIRGLEAEIEKWKVDYVTIIRSSIRFPGGDTMDDAELILFGGDRHKIRIIKLLEDARKTNPSLPTFESLDSGETHVDVYGFKHVFEDQGLLLHYLCQELTHHFLMQAGSYEEHHRKWTHFMRQHGKSVTNHYKELKTLCRGGIPDRFRKQVWRQLIYHRVKDTMEQKGMHYFRNLCNALPDSPMASCYRKQISLDLMRTMPSNTKFTTAGSKGIMDLQDVLLAFCVHNPATGYCQGMNFIVGMALLFMDAQDAFWLLVAFTERVFQKHYFDHNLIGAQSDQLVLKDILMQKLPELSKHLDGIDIEISTVTLNWFLAVFFDAVPFQTLLRIWDCFLVEGPKVLFRFSLAILKLHEKEILKKTDTISIMRHLKASAKLTYDVDNLIKVAFEEIKSFPRRQDMATKQACYLKTLKEKNKQKELQRLAYTEREHLYLKMENETGNFMGIGSAIALNDGKVWFCYGDQNVGKVSKITCEEGLMYDINLEFDSRVMCLYSASEEVALLGTLSWMLYAYNTKTRDNLWKLQLHDAILSLCCYDDKENMVTRHFAGLADGTLAVMEQSHLEKSILDNDVMYIPIGQAPISCLLLLGDQVWAASGNTVSILHARTLDTMDHFTVSINPYDHILSLIEGEYGIWVILRGSSILELWDPKTLNCKMLYDTRTDRYPQLRKEDDTYFNRARITAVVDIGQCVWVGTGEGNLIIYEVSEQANIKTPTDQSPSTDTVSSFLSNPVTPGGQKKKFSRGSNEQRQERGVKSIGKTSRNNKLQLLVAEDHVTSSNPMSTSDAASTGTSTPRLISPKLSSRRTHTSSANTDSTACRGDSTESGKGRPQTVMEGSSSVESVRKNSQNTTSKPAKHRKKAESRKGLRDTHGKESSISRGTRDAEDSTTDSCVTGDVKGYTHQQIGDESDIVSPELTSSLDQTAGSPESTKSQKSLDTTENNTEHQNNIVNEWETPSPNDNCQEVKLVSPVNGDEDSKCGHSGNDTNMCEINEQNNVVDGDICNSDSLGGCHDNSEEGQGQCVCNGDSCLADDKVRFEEEPFVERVSVENGPLHVKPAPQDNFTLNDLGHDLNFNKVMSRHLKVNKWLSSLEGPTDEDFEGLPVMSDEESGVEKKREKDLDCEVTSSDVAVEEIHLVPGSVDKVFYIADEDLSLGSEPDSSFEEDQNRPTDLRDLSNGLHSQYRAADLMYRCDSQDSVGNRMVDSHLNSNNPELQYRLEFSGVHVETDSELDMSKHNSRCGSISEMSYFNSRQNSMDEKQISLGEFGARLQSLDIRQNSLDGILFPGLDNGKISPADLVRMDNWSLSLSASPSVASSEPRFLDQMQTHTLVSRKLSLSGKRPEATDWGDVYGSGKQSSGSPRSSVDQKAQDFRRTPSISSRPSSLWSSYENISQPDEELESSGRHLVPVHSIISHSASSASLCSTTPDVFFTTELSLQMKVKIADKPVRSFLKTSCNGAPVVLSFSGCYGDDEAALKWRRDPNERLWTNEPIVEICPKTKLTRLPSYMRGRLSSASSHNSQSSSFSFHSASSRPHT